MSSWYPGNVLTRRWLNHPFATIWAEQESPLHTNNNVPEKKTPDFFEEFLRMARPILPLVRASLWAALWSFNGVFLIGVMATQPVGITCSTSWGPIAGSVSCTGALVEGERRR